MPEVRFDVERNFRSHTLNEEQKDAVKELTKMLSYE